MAPHERCDTILGLIDEVLGDGPDDRHAHKERRPVEVPPWWGTDPRLTVGR